MPNFHDVDVMQDIFCICVTDIKTAVTDMKTELDPVLGYIDDAEDYVSIQ